VTGWLNGVDALEHQLCTFSTSFSTDGCVLVLLIFLTFCLALCVAHMLARSLATGFEAVLQLGICHGMMKAWNLEIALLDYRRRRERGGLVPPEGRILLCILPMAGHEAVESTLLPPCALMLFDCSSRRRPVAGWADDDEFRRLSELWVRLLAPCPAH
jgi:hypothetical protein